MAVADALHEVRCDVAGALARAAFYRALALGLDDPSPAWRVDVADWWRRLLRGSADWPDGVRPALLRALVSLQDASLDLPSEHVRLFGPAGRAALTETSWGDAGRLLGKAAGLADVGGFYRAFGVQPGTASPRPEDHLAMELEFMSVLALKEAWARSEDAAEPLAVTRDAAAKFLTDHLGTWLAAWRAALAEQQAPELYLALGDAIGALVDAECARLGARPHRADARLYDPQVGGDELVCPLAAPAEE